MVKTSVKIMAKIAMMKRGEEVGRRRINDEDNC
jgi:hypothetical protein